ncbi:hypothetical protein TWF225_008657 [Orbilia oligospora]|nr:hypothetical protein TWF751_011173 [Orbilia oligospora]KAF3176596.1 hypothetical protein TWF225_008657 [Orbilia oligospora]KAF3252740.1 hypothetical protein TWF128_006644 [Orbilia oligospora]KAF3252846.1 hypothetical protein TWF217_007594 [Orbilia oligospora]KAF3293199.1 hypothetical protein TWF132_004854 [Orbilia oligospora]
MSLNFTASYRIKKSQPGAASQRKNPLNQLRRKSATSSPRKSSSAPSTPPVHSTSSGNNNDYDDDSLALYYPSWPTSSRSDPLPTTVLEGMKYILSNQFTPLPPTLTGLGISRDLLAEVLNYRKSFPPVVPLPHLHSVLLSPTETEREITSLVADGTLRRVTIKTGNMTSLDGVITTDDFLKSIASSSALDAEMKEAFLSLFVNNPSLTSITSDPTADNTLPKETIMVLLSAGFLTINSGDAFTSPAVDITTLTPTSAMTYITPIPEKDHSHISTLSSLSSISSSNRDASKSSSSRSSKSRDTHIEYIITPPSLGLLTNLYSATKSHLLDILRHCPHRQATIEFVREKWDGGVSKNKGSVRKKKDGEVKFEGRTRKWREHKGVTIEWVLGGLLGSGVVEGFGKGWGRGVKVVRGN